MRDRERIERISRYDMMMEEVSRATRELQSAIAAFRAAQLAAAELSRYYGSSQWREDFEADEAGLLPVTLKRGVLSEDGLYDLLTEVDELEKTLKD